ncbi:caspase family protein [Massilia sp. BJB1822]|uniref:caspase family protein n=1 Tax=Massilia sp. BJB1822 TaxID=2744470 RepID=UPI001594931D|nr:caspase family protein [Massilia sp. BJB1822]NVD99435.1 caspase family protein [Massilia sp. BJB1822]
MTAAAAQQHTHALLVGVEEYGLPGWELSGPANDALGVAAWLREIGTPAGQIQTMLAPRAAAQAAVGARLAQLGVSDAGAPSYSAVGEMFSRRLIRAVRQVTPDSAAGVLLIYWAGHGACRRSQAGEERLVYCSDLEAEMHGVLSIAAMANQLTARLPQMRLIVIVDACSTDVDKMKMSASLTPISLPPGRLGGGQARFIAYSARPGQSARNLGASEEGLFTSALLRELRQLNAASLERFEGMDQAVARAREQVSRASAGTQDAEWHWTEDLTGRTRSFASETAAKTAPTEDAAYLCDRRDQLSCFTSIASKHFAARAERPLVLLAHGGQDQYPISLVRRLLHYLKQHSTALAARTCIDAADLAIKTGIPLDGSAQEVNDFLCRGMGEALQLPQLQPAPAHLAEQLAARHSCCVFHMQLEAALLRRAPQARLAPLFDFWRNFPDVKGNSLLVFVLYISYQPSALRKLARYRLTRFLDPERRLRAFLAKPEFLQDQARLTVDCLHPELSSITLTDLQDWVADVTNRYRWRNPAMEDLQGVLGNQQSCPMDPAFGRMIRLLQQ